jgi:hypothetical protein
MANWGHVNRGRKLRNKLFAGAALALACVVSAPAHAELVSAKDPAVIRQILEGQGLPAELRKSDDSPPYLESKHNGLKFLILFMNCDDSKRNCATVQFYMSFSDADNASLENLNNWNKDKRFARAYRDDEGDPVLEMDLDLDFDGLPRKNVGEAINTWKSLMDAFQKHVND